MNFAFPLFCGQKQQPEKAEGKRERLWWGYTPTTSANLFDPSSLYPALLNAFTLTVEVLSENKNKPLSLNIDFGIGVPLMVLILVGIGGSVYYVYRKRRRRRLDDE